MAIKKTDLYSSLWASCDELRGGMDASQYKNYILTLLFVKYVSDKYAGKKHGAIVVPEGGSFEDMVAQKGKADIGDQLNKVIGKLATENDMAWLVNPDNDFNNEDRLGKGKAMVDTLSSLVGIFENLSLGKNRADGDDLLGDAYEFLMRHFATESGKSKGQFYTPSEVSRILASVLGINENTRQDETAYDPTCGSGSLLLKVNDQAPNGLTLYGQEKDNATAALAKMNMILHDCPSADIWQDDTLAEPHWLQEDGNLKTFDYAIANPPFSLKSWSNGITISQDKFNRFEYGEPPEKSGDYAFLLHIIKSLKSTGKGAVILPHGVLFRGHAEAEIRRNIIRQGYISGIIGLPANLFYGTTIPACIIVIDKAGAKAERPIFMIDASKGFMKDGNKNRLRSQDIHKIIDVFNKGLIVERYSKWVSYEEIADKNEFNLNISRYIDSSEPEDIQDLDAHLNGGIPNRDIDALQEYWNVFPTLRKTLFKDGDREGYSEPLVDECDVKSTILEHSEFEHFRSGCLALLEGWKTAYRHRLMAINVGTSPKQLIYEISEDLLVRFADAPLVSKYNAYQILMDYWAETMQDDVYMLSQDGWGAAKIVRQLVPVKDKKGKFVYSEDHDFEFGTSKTKKRYRSDIIRPNLVIDRYFSEQRVALINLEAAHEEATQRLEDFVEENSGDDGLIEEAKNEKGKVTQKGIKDRLKESTDDDEIAALKECLKLVTAESKAKSTVKAARDALDALVFRKIPTISEDELKDIIVNAKWFVNLEDSVIDEIDRVTKNLANRVRTLEKRYSQTLPSLSEEVAKHTDLVESHLKMMGLSW
tara:strand:- start:6298 stop:8751 length:2454 start_codon:yes stop_codon:yes gene_type:complete